MAETRRLNLYRNIIGDAKETIDAIQRFIEENSPKAEKKDEKSQPALSIKRILESVADEETTEELQKIIDSL